MDYSLCRAFFKNHFSIAFGNRDFKFMNSSGKIKPKNMKKMNRTTYFSGDREVYTYKADQWNHFEYIKTSDKVFRWKWTVNHDKLKDKETHRILTFKIKNGKCGPGELVDVTEHPYKSQFVLHHSDIMCSEVKSFVDQKGIMKNKLLATDHEIRKISKRYYDTPHLSLLKNFLSYKTVFDSRQRNDAAIKDMLVEVHHLCQDNGYYGPRPVSKAALEAVEYFDLIKDDWHSVNSQYDYRHDQESWIDAGKRSPAPRSLP